MAVKSPSATRNAVASAARRPCDRAYPTTSVTVGPGIRTRMVAAATKASQSVTLIAASPLEKRLQAGLRPPEDQRVYVVRPLIRVDRLQVHRMAHDVELERDAVAAVHVARHAGDVQRLADICPLDDGDHLRRHLALVEEAADAQGALQAERDLRLHVGELLLHQLRCRQRPAELLALQRVLARPVPAILRRPHGPPGDAVAGAVEAPERAREPRDVRQ